MKFPWTVERREDVVTMSTSFKSSFSEYSDIKTVKAIIDEFAHMYVKNNYKQLVKAIDKEALVKELSIGLAEEVMRKMLGGRYDNR